MKSIVLLLITTYQRLISRPLVVIFGTGCRFHPTCSIYAKDAIENYGVVLGVKLFVKRILRCHPRSIGGFDPVPK